MKFPVVLLLSLTLAMDGVAETEPTVESVPISDSATPGVAVPAWESVSENQLRAFRGAISTARLNLPYGPRPGRDNNVFFTATYQVYGASDRARMRAAYRSRGYTHWAIGPVGRRAPLYHNQYPAAPFDSIGEPDRYADLLAELWHDGVIPVYFALPDTPDYMGADGWNWEAVERDLTPIYSSTRWQSLVRVVALAWEPDIPAAEWQRGVHWLARVFPNALRYVHLPADHFVPCRSSELGQNGGVIPSEGAAWRPVGPLIHGILFQFGAMGQDGSDNGGRTPRQQFLFNLWEQCRHWHEGDQEWPTTSAATGRRLDVVAFEYASYWNYWENVPEAEARAWGDAAMGKDGPVIDPVAHESFNLSGMVAGYGDGGTVEPAQHPE